MISKSDWQVVQERMIEEDRRKLGQPPTAEEALAYTRGELSAEEEARVRELLVCYPELARTLTHPFPSDGEPLSEEESDLRWEEFQRRIQRGNGGRVLRFWRASAALAAALALLFGALLWRAQLQISSPRIASSEQLLLPDGQRGPGNRSTTLNASGESILLVLALVHRPEFSDYRAEITDADGARPLWTSGYVDRRDDESLAILVPLSFLEPERYRVVLYGVDGARQERVATYSFLVPGR